MRKQNPLITDEHIVAYLDGELQGTPEFEREIRSDSALARSADEYAAISKAFASSMADSRFLLSAKVDSRTKKMLADSIAKLRSAVRIPASAPDAAPRRSVMPAVRNMKLLWAKRASVGFAFAAL